MPAYRVNVAGFGREPSAIIFADSPEQAVRAARPGREGLGLIAEEINMPLEHIKRLQKYLIPALLMGLGATLGLAIPFAGFHLYQTAHGGEIALVVVLLALITALYFWGRNLRARIREDFERVMDGIRSLHLTVEAGRVDSVDARIARDWGLGSASASPTDPTGVHVDQDWKDHIPAAGPDNLGADLSNPGFTTKLPIAGEWDPDAEPMPLEKVVELAPDPLEVVTFTLRPRSARRPEGQHQALLFAAVDRLRLEGNIVVEERFEHDNRARYVVPTAALTQAERDAVEWLDRPPT